MHVRYDQPCGARSCFLPAYDTRHWDFDCIRKVWDLAFITERAKHNILGGNAARMFKRAVGRRWCEIPMQRESSPTAKQRNAAWQRDLSQPREAACREVKRRCYGVSVPPCTFESMPPADPPRVAGKVIAFSSGRAASHRPSVRPRTQC